jgi:hypothetical protein
MSKKIERLIIAACIGAIAACVLCWVEFYPVLAPVEAIRVPDGKCDKCDAPRWTFYTETTDPDSAVTEEYCMAHAPAL